MIDVTYSNLGKIAILWGHSKLHCEWPHKLFLQYVLAPVKLHQFLILEDSFHNPLAYVSWAYFDVLTESKYIINPHSLTPDEWKSGDRLWLMDFVSPFNKIYTLELIKILRQNLFSRSIARSLRVKSHSKVANIYSYAGCDLSTQDRVRLYAFLRESVKNYIIHDKVRWM